MDYSDGFELRFPSIRRLVHDHLRKRTFVKGPDFRTTFALAYYFKQIVRHRVSDYNSRIRISQVAVLDRKSVSLTVIRQALFWHGGLIKWSGVVEIHNRLVCDGRHAFLLN